MLLPPLNYRSTPPALLPPSKKKKGILKQIADFFSLQTHSAEAYIYRTTIPILFVCGLKKLFFQLAPTMILSWLSSKKKTKQFFLFLFFIFQQAEERASWPGPPSPHIPFTNPGHSPDLSQPGRGCNPFSWVLAQPGRPAAGSLTTQPQLDGKILGQGQSLSNIKSIDRSCYTDEPNVSGPCQGPCRR